MGRKPASTSMYNALSLCHSEEQSDEESFLCRYCEDPSLNAQDDIGRSPDTPTSVSCLSLEPFQAFVGVSKPIFRHAAAFSREFFNFSRAGQNRFFCRFCGISSAEKNPKPQNIVKINRKFVIINKYVEECRKIFSYFFLKFLAKPRKVC